MIAKLIELIPRANFVDSSGTPRFIGSATAPVDVDQWTADISHNLSQEQTDCMAITTSNTRKHRAHRSR